MAALKQSLKIVRRRNTLANMAALTRKTEFASVAQLVRRSTEASCYPVQSPTTTVHHHRHHIEQFNNIAEQIIRKRKQPARKHSLIIFDKDGTLICFHSMWVPWAKSVVKRLCKITNLDIGQQVCELLGFCPLQERVRDGLLAHGTMGQIRERITALLVECGLEKEKATEMVQMAVRDCDANSPDRLRQIHDLRQLFGELKANQVKIAVCTSDSRIGTVSVLRSLGLENFVDFVMCGDDLGSMPKPNPHNALHICRMLGVDPQEAVMVGDTAVDVQMGRLANLGACVGVLSGIGDTQELSPYADHIVNNVGEILSKLFGKNKNARKMISF